MEPDHRRILRQRQPGDRSRRQPHLQTIWDGDGIDTYDLSNYSTNLNLDLNPGAHSVFSSAQLAYLGGGPNGGYARGNVFNALQYNGDARSLIENARGGSGSDVIRGNQADNVLEGNGANDRLFGDVGDDTLDGGTGHDRLEGGTGDDTYIVDSFGDVVVEAAGAGVDVIFAIIDYVLPDFVEDLILTGLAAIDGLGNATDNVHGWRNGRETTILRPAGSAMTGCSAKPVTMFSMAAPAPISSRVGAATTSTSSIASAMRWYEEAGGRSSTSFESSVNALAPRQRREPHPDRRRRHRLPPATTIANVLRGNAGRQYPGRSRRRRPTRRR